mmetsp:Transcript_15316/g.47973  ORF Transcript_15316/g.47973 Transcript_15316/m.47973 type:complete len:220 (-) Transcript_15316:104-763(-)|eukprot:CAMPEP_0197389532 /NCGR_PEP_ID=MMETSP1165-20131217/1775_1 /TAXON_ID=284809 /ORGANISM="Chrysocystis fragilis, Strain CCMP3189" /LENGTH=219 /DNA_ID=CAMNT_0042914953 /DNA_START=25 /DNA_END=684 /DNA_ORIENTATION=-
MARRVVCAVWLSVVARALISPVAHRRRGVALSMGVVEPGNFKNGLTIEFQDSVWKILSFQQTKSARQAAMVRTKLKNLISGTTVEQTFRISESIQTANVEKSEAIFSYVDGDNVVFLDAQTFEELRIPQAEIPNADLIKDGMAVQVVKWGEVVVDVILPSVETYEITYTEPGLKKATSTGQTKLATLETGAEIPVPLFVEIGDLVKVNCADRAYLERTK